MVGGRELLGYPVAAHSDENEDDTSEFSRELTQSLSGQK
jgi:hypothetical protein